MGGYWEDVIDDLKLIEEEASDVGLQLNRSKTELFCSDSATRSKVLSAFPADLRVNERQKIRHYRARSTEERRRRRR